LREMEIMRDECKYIALEYRAADANAI